MRALLLITALQAFAAVTALAGEPAARVAPDHLALHVADHDASAEFYKRVFGLNEIPSTAAERMTWLAVSDGFTLHLISGRISPLLPEKSVHLALKTNDLDALAQHLKELGVIYSDFAGTPGAFNHRSDGVRQIYFQDPDGYWIEVNDTLK